MISVTIKQSYNRVSTPYPQYPVPRASTRVLSTLKLLPTAALRSDWARWEQVGHKPDLGIWRNRCCKSVRGLWTPPQLQAAALDGVKWDTGPFGWRT